MTVLVAQKVVFEGLKRTKPSYLLKFMGWENRIPTDPSVLKQVCKASGIPVFLTKSKVG
ncbi:MAG: hypothetical protein HC817_16760 [Saprospiraceae bacterium]|nr:hypothetical protein [Saprospiraceae bacterium]